MSHTIVLVHGAFAESASWAGVIESLTGDGHRAVTVANPLRGLASDADGVSDVVRTIDGPVVLAAHSYGGAVITNVDRDAGGIVGLVYISAFAPDTAENCFGLAGRFPGTPATGHPGGAAGAVGGPAPVEADPVLVPHRGGPDHPRRAALASRPSAPARCAWSSAPAPRTRSRWREPGAVAQVILAATPTPAAA